MSGRVLFSMYIREPTASLYGTVVMSASAPDVVGHIVLSMILVVAGVSQGRDSAMENVWRSFSM